MAYEGMYGSLSGKDDDCKYRQKGVVKLSPHKLHLQSSFNILMVFLFKKKNIYIYRGEFKPPNEISRHISM